MGNAFSELKLALIDGATFAYRESGAGNPVLLVHGTASDLRIWTDLQTGLLPDFGSRYRVIAYSRRFARPNDDIAPGTDDQMLPHVADLIAFLQAVDAVPAHLVGHSWGGFIALLAAIRHPDSVRSLVLMEPPVVSLYVSTPPRPAEFVRLLLSRPRTALAIARFGATALAPAQKAFRAGDDNAAIEAFGRGVLGLQRFDNLSAAQRERFWDNRSSARAQLLGAGVPALTDQEVRSVEAPVLLLAGAESPPLFQRLTDRLQELLPTADRVEIPDASHAMQEDNPRAWAAEVRAFLDRRA
jgi:pimeloyl-ACP methyl ester carboxylesterase